MRLVLGLDPGGSMGMALVLHGVTHGRDNRPRLVNAWHVMGGSGLLWLSRLYAASNGLTMTLADYPDVPVSAVVEVPANGGRNSNRPTKATTWVKAGRNAGKVEGVVYASCGLVFADMPSGRTKGGWPALCGVSTGKQGNGIHRVREASMLVAGAREHLATMPEDSDAAIERKVCVAESILIACAGGLQ